MSLKVSGLGAEPKKLAVLGACVLVATYFYFSNRTSGDSTDTGSRTLPAASEAPSPLQKAAAKPARLRGKLRNNDSLDFHPSLKPRDGQLDRANIDPTLRLDLLERVQNVKIGDINRSLFESLTAPPVELAKVAAEPAKIIPKFEYFGPQPPPKPAPPPPEPAAPPIPLKFYGFIHPVRSSGPKRAFFLDGDDIIVANEGQLIKNRYKIVRIGINSADVEDTQFKKNNRQTLPLVEEQNS